MSHKFTRNITGVRNITKQGFSTNNQNDLLSGDVLDSTKKYPVWVRSGFHYHCLTDNIKTINGTYKPDEHNNFELQTDWNQVDSKNPNTIHNKPFQTIGDGLEVVNKKLELEKKAYTFKESYLITESKEYTFELPKYTLVLSHALNKNEPTIHFINKYVNTKTNNLFNFIVNGNIGVSGNIAEGDGFTYISPLWTTNCFVTCVISDTNESYHAQIMLSVYRSKTDNNEYNFIIYTKEM